MKPARVGLIGVAVAALLLVAAFRIDDLPLIGGGDTHTAAFRDASGLAEGNEVRVAGVKVGKVTAVSLARGAGGAYVRVSFRVSDVALGPQTGATIRIKTVLGQKYLALHPQGTGSLTEEIPLERTSSPFDVIEAVQGLAGTLDQIDTAQLAQAFTVLTETFDDTPAAVKASLDGLSRLSKTVAQRDGQLRELLAHARNVTGVLAERDEEFRKLLTDANLLLAEVQRRRDAIHTLLTATSELADQISGLITENSQTLKPALQKLRAVVGVLQRNRSNLEATLTSLAPFVNAFANVVGNGRWFDSYVDGLVQGLTPTVRTGGN
ncbi:ABC transporter substrate-binding protein [Rhizocola hellebori]|uniref:ABC transporter substrate-binding protein n=1 Tax=Rhizocola hellebori TaxID=1392758 RepID=A0A8J3Q5X6_9ACTN|nr:MCE family protein [Rhizocola hellebori]GIH04638.1 ABC transporter substrate-binding protein [Rhizocola hellebori]